MKIRVAVSVTVRREALRVRVRVKVTVRVTVTGTDRAGARARVGLNVGVGVRTALLSMSPGDGTDTAFIDGSSTVRCTLWPDACTGHVERVEQPCLEKRLVRHAAVHLPNVRGRHGTSAGHLRRPRGDVLTMCTPRCCS